MTKSEINWRAEIRKELQSKGIIPSTKKNRKKFIEEAIEQWEKRDVDCHMWESYIMDAMLWMTAYIDSKGRSSMEAVGVSKVYKIALKFKEFEEERRKIGKPYYTLEEMYENLKDIMEA